MDADQGVCAVRPVHNPALHGSVGRMTSLTVPARFNGPPTSGNGGWTAGAVAEAAGTLGAVPPLTVSL